MLKFATVAVVVRNEKRALKWWTEKLGFRVVTSFPHWITVAPRGANVHLHLCPDSRPEKGNTGFMFSTQDAVKEEARLRKEGVKITHPVAREEWGTIFGSAARDGTEFQKTVPQSSFVTGCVIFTPFLRSRASSFTASCVENKNPVFPYSGRESGQRCRWTFAP